MHAVQQCVRLPAAGAVAAYVAAVTDDNAALVEKFVERRDSIAAELKPDTASDEIEPSSGGQWSRRRLAALVAGTAVVTVVVTAVITALITAAVVGPDTEEPTAETGAAPQTGDDPIFSGCSADAVRANAPQTVEGMSVFVIYSPACNAVWGKIERTDGAGAGDSISVVTYRGNDPTRSDTQRAVEPGVGNAYSPLIVRSGTEPICVTGSVTVDNGARTIKLPEPQCT
ncbi:DUF2690 domain-containing protein [Rhodococcus sp. 14-2470-1b]|uniref:DUF2690 domain-containing protein n=1 Tax=Rhodococcus sp. 14-2470-1b TaxID=2023149 RepID=UPI0015958D2B|nr:DUF2690 domain-containing protein [Rhodococcus sp. 14-2470-1b]